MLHNKTTYSINIQFGIARVIRSCNTGNSTLPDMYARTRGAVRPREVSKLCNITFVAMDFPLILPHKVIHYSILYILHLMAILIKHGIWNKC